LRDYRNAYYYGKQPSGPFDAEVVIVGDANEGAVKPFLGNRYFKREMRLVWWPDEGYKGLTWARLFGGEDQNGNPVQGIFEPENFKKLIREYWFYHDSDNSLNNWPYVHRFSLYVRKDIAGELWQYAGVAPAAVSTQPDPYLEKYIQGIQAQAVVPASNSQLN